MTDIFRRSSAAWEGSGHGQVLWVILVLVSPLLGPLLCFLLARPFLLES
ncbi:MAG: hypothetical protein PVJ28_11610 [Acidimicrobiia bacterium]|jgi:hypothetical protein